jgi:branched-chain amino acid transport system substrate-binding protein
MKKILWLAIVMIVLVVCWSFINKNTGPTSVVKIGVIAPLTGQLAEYGEAFKNGITLAQEELGNDKLEFIFEDSAYDSGKAISAFNKLKDLNKVNLVINWGDPTSEAIGPVAKNALIPFIAVTTIPAVSEMSPNTIRTLNKSEEAAEATWAYLRSKNFKKIGIIKLETAYFNSLLGALIKTKKADEKVTVVDTYLSFGDKDFKTSIAKVKGQQYDSIGVFLAGGQISQFYKQADAIGLKTPTFGTDFFESQNDIDAAGKSMNGVVYVNYDVSDKFRDAYTKRFTNVSQIAYAGNGYDTVMMLGDVKNGEKDSILAVLKSVKNYSGVLGKWNYIENGGDKYLASPFHVKEIQDGKIKTIK